MYKMKIIAISGYCLLFLCMVSIFISSNDFASYARYSKPNEVSADINKSEKYDIKVKVMDGDVEIQGEDKRYNLESNKEYKITIKAFGNAKNGSCKISYNNENLFTRVITNGDELTFFLIPDENTTYYFTAILGNIRDYTINDNVTIGKKIIDNIEENNIDNDNIVENINIEDTNNEIDNNNIPIE